MINSRKLVGVMESHAAQAKKEGHDDRAATLRGVRAMTAEVHESLGMTRDHFGRPSIAPGSMSPQEYSLVEIAEAIGDQLGFRGFARSLFDKSEQMQFHGVTALEAGPGIDPTAFAAISLWTATAAGLVEAQVIQRFQNPLFIGDKLVETMPTRLNGQKFVGVTGIGDKAQTRNPGEPHPRAGFGQHYVTTPELEEKALAVEVTQEADFYDITGQVMDTAGSVGEELGYRKEVTQLDLVLGITNPYNYSGTGYNTYQASTPWVNSQSNPLSDFNDIDDSLDLFRQMTDPVTGKEILVQPTQIIHHPSRRMDFYQVLNATEVRTTTNTNTLTLAPNPLTGSRYELLESQIAANRMTAAAGLNLSAANAKARWYHGDFRKAFKWMEAWPLRVNPVTANEFVMRDRGLIAAFFANYRGIGAVREPRHAVVNTN